MKPRWTSTAVSFSAGAPGRAGLSSGRAGQSSGRSGLAVASAIAATITFTIAATGCHNKFEAVVDGVLLAESDRGEPAPAAPRVVIRTEATVPDEQLPFPPGAVQLVIERSVPWARVETLLAILESKKVEPILLTGQTHKVHRFRLNDELTGAPKFTITGDANGKFCVQTAQLPQAYCVAGGKIAGKHIHRAFVRETVREVVKKWEMNEAEIYVDPAMDWADVVRLVDGARTCCGKATTVLVRVAREAPLGPDAESGNPGVRDLEAEAEEAAAAAEEAGAAAPAAAPAAPVAPGTAAPAPATAAPTAPAPAAAAPAAPAPAAR